MSIVDLNNCKQEDGESTTHWVRQVKEIIHSSDKMDAGSAVLMLEKNCRFEPLKQKLGRLTLDRNDMGTLMVALVKYADFDTTMNIYTHITQDMKKSEFDNLAEKLQKQWETSQPKTEADG